MASCTPGVPARYRKLAHHRSVRFQRRAVRQLCECHQVRLSCVGTNPLGTLLKPMPVNAISPRINHQRDSGGTYRDDQQRSRYFPDAHPKNRLKPLKNQPNMNSNARENRFFLSHHATARAAPPAPGSSSAVERRNHRRIAIVNANCL